MSGIYTKVLVEFLAESMPGDCIQELLRRAGETRSLDELGDASSWSSYDQFRRLLEERARLDPVDLYEKTGLLSSWLKRWEMAEAAHGHESPGTLLASGSDGNPLVPIRRYEKSEVAPNEWTIKEWFVDGYAPYPEFCDFAALQYALIPILFELPPGEVVEEECQFRGDAACLFRFRWEQLDGDASKADFFRVRSQMLEARLEQIQDMITDLASNDCYEDVLQGFVDVFTADGGRCRRCRTGTCTEDGSRPEGVLGGLLARRGRSARPRPAHRRSRTLQDDCGRSGVGPTSLRRVGARRRGRCLLLPFTSDSRDQCPAGCGGARYRGCTRGRPAPGRHLPGTAGAVHVPHRDREYPGDGGQGGPNRFRRHRV